MEQSSFFNAEKTANGTYDRTYNAEDWAAYFSTFIGNGVSCTPDTNLQVESSSGMNVIVNSGVAFINGYRYENTTPLTVQINQANSTYDRITRIILELNLNNRNIICTTLDGTAEPNPQPPSLTRTDSIYQLQLATVYVPAGATAIGTITDTRENTEVCGYMQMLAPTIPPAFLANLTLQGTIKNVATITGGTYENASTHGTLSNYGTINGGTISNATLDNVNLSGKVNNFATITGGTYENATTHGTLSNYGTINGGTISNITLDNVNLSGKVNNFTTISGGTYNNPTLTGQVNINNGLYNNGNAVVTQQINITGNVYITDTIQAYYRINYWVLDGGLLGSKTNNLKAKLGLMTISLYLDQTYTWNSGDPITLDIDGIPNVSAMTMTYNKAFNIGTGTNAIVINGIDSNGTTLNANQTYTSQALLWGL